MAKDDVEKDEITIAVPLRRLLTGVPRTKRAPAAIPRVKRFVLRHIDPDWRDAIWDEDRGQHRVWIDDFLNKSIWSRGREHVSGAKEWIQGAEGQRPRLAQRTTSRYGSVLKVKALFLEKPEDGGDARVEVYLYGYDDLAKEKEGEDEEEEEGEEKETQEEEAEGEEADEEEEAEEKPAASEPKAPQPKEGKAGQAPKPSKEKPASKSAAAKSGKASAPAKDETKKPAPKPKKEGGD